MAFLVDQNKFLSIPPVPFFREITKGFEEDYLRSINPRTISTRKMNFILPDLSHIHENFNCLMSYLSSMQSVYIGGSLPYLLLNDFHDPVGRKRKPKNVDIYFVSSSNASDDYSRIETENIYYGKLANLETYLFNPDLYQIRYRSYRWGSKIKLHVNIRPIKSLFEVSTSSDMNFLTVYFHPSTQTMHFTHRYLEWLERKICFSKHFPRALRMIKYAVGDEGYDEPDHVFNLAVYPGHRKLKMPSIYFKFIVRKVIMLRETLKIWKSFQIYRILHRTLIESIKCSPPRLNGKFKGGVYYKNALKSYQKTLLFN